MESLSSGISGMFAPQQPPTQIPPGATPPFVPQPAQTDPGDTGPWATTGGGTLPTQDPSVSRAPVPGGKIPGGGFNIASVLPAAVGGLGSIIGLARGQGSATDKALKAQAQSTKGLQNASNQAIQAYSSGTLTPAQQAARDREKAAMVAQVEQAMANSGTPQGTAHAQALAYVEQQLAAQDAALWQQNFNSGLAGIGLTQGNLASLAKQQALQDAEQRKAWSDFMAALGKLGTDIGPIFT